VLPKALNPTEDAHPESMSTFGTDEHLRAPTAPMDVPSNGNVPNLSEFLDRRSDRCNSGKREEGGSRGE